MQQRYLNLLMAVAVGTFWVLTAFGIVQSNLRLDGYPYPGIDTTNTTGETVQDGVPQSPRPPPLSIRGYPQELPGYPPVDGGGGGTPPVTAEYPTNILVGYMMTGTDGEEDIGPFGYDLTTTSTVDLVTDTVPYNGFMGGARRFDSGEFLIGTNAFTELQNVRSNFAIAAWMYADDAWPSVVGSSVLGRYLETGNKRVYNIGIRGAQGNLYSLYSANGTAITSIQGGSQIPSTASNRWYHLLVNYHGDGSQAMYWNADFTATNATMAYFPVTDTDAPISLGASGTGLLPWNGLIAEAVIFDTPLNEDEIHRLVYSGLGTMGTNTLVVSNYHGMIAGYLMDNATTNTDITGMGQLAYNKASVSNTGPNVVSNVPPGFTGSSLNFELGEGDYLSVSNSLLSSQVQTLMYEGTVMAWIKAESLPEAYNYILSRFDAVGDMRSWAMSQSSTSGRITWESSISGTATSANQEFGAKSVGTWYHIAITWSRRDPVPMASVNYATVIYYVDGVESRNVELNNVVPLIMTDAPLMIGAAGGEGAPTNHFDGLVDEVAVFNLALAVGEIQGYMTNGIDGAKVKNMITVLLNQ